MKFTAILLFIVITVLTSVSVCADTLVIPEEPQLESSLPTGLSLDALVFIVSLVCSSIVVLLAIIITLSRIKKNRK